MTFEEIADEVGMEIVEMDPRYREAVKELRKEVTSVNRRRRQMQNRGKNVRRNKKRKTVSPPGSPPIATSDGLSVGKI